MTHNKMDCNHQLDISDVTEDSLLAERVAKRDDKIQGIRYITEDLILKLTKQDNLAHIKTLNLAITKTEDKKFKFIENLEKCGRLEVLNLSHNVIEKIEKLENLHKLKELHLSNNRIHKIVCLEHMAGLQLLNLSSNYIEHVPMWLPKKLRSLRTLNLRNNKISSLQDVSRLKPLKNLTELSVTENPVSKLPHYRLYLVFHLRSLEKLDEQSISQDEREQAQQRFHMEEIERLEQDLELRVAEICRLQKEKAAAVKELEHQEVLIDQRQLKSLQDQQYQAQLKQELDTKTELLKQKTVELTRACQKQYELEQELAFQKIDAKFEPYPYYLDDELEAESLLCESTYIGKARHKRNTVVSDSVQGHQVASANQTEMDNPRQGVLMGNPLDCIQQQTKAEEYLQQLLREIQDAEHQILRAGGELRQLEESLSQKQDLEAEKEQVRQQLQKKIQCVRQLRDEAKAMEDQLERQRGEMSQTQGQMRHLQSLLDHREPQHAHLKAQITSKSQLLDMMSKKHRELEVRLDDMLSRIAKETEEIKNLEQQLTDGQIAANDALKKDLEGIISGLQDYLSGVKEQARHAQADCYHLHRERESLQRQLMESQERCQLLERIASAAETAQAEARIELKGQQNQLKQLMEENVELQRKLGHISAYEVELESQLQEHTTEAGQLKEELGRMHRLSQLEQAALQAELEKERLAKENAQAQMEQHKQELQEQLRNLQDVKVTLEERVGALQSSLEQIRGTMLCPLEVQRCIEEMTKTIASGQIGHFRVRCERDVVGHCLEQLQQEILGLVSAAQTGWDQAQLNQALLSQEMALLRQQHKAACQTASQATEAEKLGEEEIRRLREEVQVAREFQKQVGQQLREADDEREHLLARLEEQHKLMEVGEYHSQQQLRSLDMELRELKSSFTTADKMAAQQLHTTKEQLRSLHDTVEQISQERAEDAEDCKRSRVLTDEITQNLTKAEAEIKLLQNLLKDQMDLIDHPGLGEVSGNSIQQQELNNLKRSLNRQEAQTKGLREQLALARKKNSGNLEELMSKVRALREDLLQQNQVLSSLRDPHRPTGYWYYVPPATNAPCFGSQGTQDSGLGSQYLSSPDRGRRTSMRHRGVRKDRAPPSGGGYWVYSTLGHAASHTSKRKDEARDSGGDSDVADCSSSNTGSHCSPPHGSAIYTTQPDGLPIPPGSVIYAPPADDLAVSPGTAIYGPPPQGAQLVYGPITSILSGAWPHTGGLYCNNPEHQDMERELCRLKQMVKERHAQGEEEEEKAHVKEDMLRLLEQRTHLKLEHKKLHRSLRQLHQRLREVQEGRCGSEVLEEVLDKSLQRHGTLLDEVECVEKTLLRRRAELREADRLLLEAQSSFKDTNNKTKDALHKYTKAQQQLDDTEHELEELELRARDSATLLVEAQQHLQIQQGKLQELQRSNEEQTDTLHRVEEVVAARDMDFQELNKKVALRQQELSVLDRALEQWHTEERAMEERRRQQRMSLEEALQQGDEAKELAKELQGDVEALYVQKGELKAQLAERSASMEALKQQVHQEEESLLSIRSQINQHKADLKRVLETLQLENEELQGVKLQQDQRLDQLEKCQNSLLQARVELQALQQEAAHQRTEAEHQKTETVHQRRLAEENARERSRLEEQCRNLETRRTYADRCLDAANQGARAAEAELNRLQTELGQLRQEHRQALTHREKMGRDDATTRQQIDQQSELLRGLKEQVEEKRCQLETLEEERRVLIRCRDSVAREKQEMSKQLEEDKGKAKQLEVNLEELHAHLAEQQAQLQCAQELQHQAKEKEESQRQRLHVLKSQCRAVEGTLAQHSLRLEQVTAEVAHMEARRLNLESEKYDLMQERVSQLGQELHRRDAQLQEQAEELQTLQRELGVCRAEVQHLQEEKDSAESRMQAQKSCDKGQKAKLQESEKERARLRRELVLVEQAAEEHQQKARCLQMELNTVSNELMSLKDALRSQEDGESRLREIREALRSLKTDVKAELNSGVVVTSLHTETSLSDADDHKENQYSMTAVPQPAYNPTDEHWRGDVLRERLRQQEDHLKAQLRRRMFSQEEYLSHRRQQTEGSLQGLRRRVDKLDQLLGNSPSDSPSPEHHNKQDSVGSV
ncbi:hypothetical protein UPYG_G00178550 [Umbra pygmaea]|uniref:Centriolin n=1 Tax=Umbra pygmaea TaxID=75934 RepID=A0ABD0XB32_UMBPY